jgi:tetratricopeptide (TPR) repeat protein
LVNVADGSHLWSETYDRQLESVFAIQDEISRSIVDVLKIRLLGEERAAFVKRHTENLEAYNAYVQGRFLWNKRTEEHLMKAIEYFEKAIELDNNYALAYAGLADAYSVLPSNVGTPVEEVLPKAREAAGKALELDDKLAEAHASLGLIIGMGKKREEAEKEFLRAIKLNPGYAYAHYWYSTWLDALGRHEEAVGEVEMAYELDPLSVVILTNLASKKGAGGDSLAAVQLFERALEIEPSRTMTYVAYAGYLREMLKPDEAVRIYSRALEANPTYRDGYNLMAYAYDQMGNYGEAIRAVNRYLELSPDEANPYDSRGEIRAHNGELDRAIEDFERALEIDPNFTASSLKLAAAYLFKREYAKAQSLMKRLLSSDEEYIRAKARSTLALIPVFKGKLNQALSALDEGIPSEMSEETEGWYRGSNHAMKFYIYLEQGDLNMVLRELDTIRELAEKQGSKDPVRLRDAYAILRALQGQTAEADELLRSWRADIDQNNRSQMSRYWRIAGMVELIRGNAGTATTFLSRGIWEGSAPLFEARYFLAQAYLEAGQPGKAAEVLEKALSRYDDQRAGFPIWSVKAHYLLGLAYEKSGRSDGAVKQYQEFLAYWKDADPDIAEVDDAKERLARLKRET